VLTALTLATFSGLGIWYSRSRVRTIEDFITARGSIGRGMLTATLIASVMGVWILLSPPEAGAAFGGISAVVGYAIGEALPMLAYAKLGPRIRTLIPEGHSLTEYALARYGPTMYAFVLVVSVFYMFIFIAAELTGITSALELVAGVPRWQTALLIGGFVLLYTSYGGLRASIFTDTIQVLLILPLLAISAVATVFALGGTGAIHAEIVQSSPSILDPGFLPGLRFGVYTAVAILGAEMLNQSWWQRIYAAEDDRALGRGFGVAAVANVAVVFLAGLFGVLARGHLDLVLSGDQYNASIAFFLLLQEAFPTWLVFGVVLLAVLLVMSTADTGFNALASIVTADLPRILDDPSDRALQTAARLLTAAVALAAVYVSLQARSVLQLFFLSDLLAAAVMVPLLSGLYSRGVSERGVLLAGLAGLAVGLAYFPNPAIRGALTSIPGLATVLPTPAYFPSFIGAAGVSTLLTGLAAVAPGPAFDLDRLSRTVTRLDDAATDGGQEVETE
jgi:Na+/proline symporter